MKRPPAVPCRGTERLLYHDTSLPTDSDDGQCLVSSDSTHPSQAGTRRSGNAGRSPHCRNGVVGLAPHFLTTNPSHPHYTIVTARSQETSPVSSSSGVCSVSGEVSFSSTGAVASNSAGSLRPMTKAVSEGVN